ncbi:MAG: type II toxin-antitoxin system VapC family toxin [Vicinamibacterales bacterium]
MSGWLLDTNVISELRKPRCHDAVKTWSEVWPPELLYLSRITIAEIRCGIERHPRQSLREQLEAWLEEELRPWFGERVLELDEEVILEWRRMVQRGKATGHTFSQPDLFIAATAAVAGLVVVTRNVADFALAGVPVYNPWTGVLRK